jgi:hypothetical protein
MIDYDKYTYNKLGNYSNVVTKLEKDQEIDDSVTLVVHYYMEPLIAKVSLEHPEWLFVGEGFKETRVAGHYGATRFDVYQDNEPIGRISLDGWQDSNYKWEIYNERIAKTRQRRGGTSTSDLNKARKLINSQFSKPTPNEMAERVAKRANSVIHDKSWTAQRRFDGHFSKVIASLSEYITKEFDAVAPALVQYGATEEQLKAVRVAQEDRVFPMKAEQIFKKSQGYVAFQSGDTYYMMAPQSDRVVDEIKSADLPTDLKAKIGMLKMVSPEDGIEDVGYRLDHNSFYILP